ncbi:hypothetical protein NVP1049O_33 [Vibrio phage 1.049.O._10N.286.54.B5]|nr:hypothetical protein NVP1049O_33 [Vibrio phage 1.049.O._10N.286.54.B5]AUR84202.1 hypothetical protein NVP1050O_33 [Vibrio phage 1.050.O._10N.286.48.A6]
MGNNHSFALLARAIAVALNNFADSISDPNAQAASIAQTATAQAPSTQVNVATNAGVANTTLQDSTDSGLLSAVETVAAGKELTGTELDNNGVPWLKEVNTKKPALTTKGIYKKGVGISADVYAAAIEAAKLVQAQKTQVCDQVIAGVNEAAAEHAASTAPMPGQTAGAPLPGTPMPGQTAGAPMPGQTANTPPVDAHVKWKQPILNEIARLTNEMGVDFQCVSELLTEFGATDGTFITVAADQYEKLHLAVVGWNVCLQLVANATAECLAMNGNDQATIIEYIYTQGQFGCTDATLVNKHDTWRLYEKLAEYRGQLEAHFQKPVTPKAANPFNPI